MKKKLQDLADALLSKEQIRTVKGGTTWYCNCYGTFTGFPSQPGPHPGCTVLCGPPPGSGGGGSGCSDTLPGLPPCKP
ncbi:TIGR04149 family rSAM-modified RiPP [Spirosoma montaniterrae]|uniref:TIGR04149 family rSAM-modified RiPP n=1 Tax=Spirosoma montaniterrae TaxID=1178516 RepID=UPI00097CF567|nr:TIGR04149 family rSAM-modified RiPP [Spirosoma montaniterrae]